VSIDVSGNSAGDEGMADLAKVRTAATVPTPGPSSVSGREPAEGNGVQSRRWLV